MFTEFALMTGGRDRARRSTATVPALVGRLHELESRTACSATPVAAQFNAVNNYGLTGIMVDGQNLALGNGFHIIGSVTGQDNNDNINSENPGNAPGVMTSPQGNMPYSLQFSRDPRDASKISFAITVGPSQKLFKELNIPLECPMQLFGYYRSSNSPTVRRYDQLPFAYPSANGNYYAGHIFGAQWGEIIGPKYTMRVTITSAVKNNAPNNMELQVVNAPGLSTGDRDLEFKFGQLPAGQRASVTGTIQVFRSDVSLLPVAMYEAESSPYHQTGRRDGDGWSATVRDPSRAYLQYGPYINVGPWAEAGGSGLSAGSHTATFRLMLDNVTADNSRILTIDVFDAKTGQSVKKLDITRKMFDTGAFRYKGFTLDFMASPGQQLEFRTFYWGGAYVRQDSVRIV